MKSLSVVEHAPGDCSNPAGSPASSEDDPVEREAAKAAPRAGIRGLLRSRFLRFLLVGGLNTVFGYTLFAVCILIGLAYPIAALVSTVLGVLFNFKSYGTLVFGSHDNRLILRFFAVYGVCYLVGLLPLAWAKSHGAPILLVAAVCALPMAAFAFGLQRAFVFRGRVGRLDLKPSG